MLEASADLLAQERLAAGRPSWACSRLLVAWGASERAFGRPSYAWDPHGRLNVSSQRRACAPSPKRTLTKECGGATRLSREMTRARSCPKGLDSSTGSDEMTC